MAAYLEHTRDELVNRKLFSFVYFIHNSLIVFAYRRTAKNCDSDTFRSTVKLRMNNDKKYGNAHTNIIFFLKGTLRAQPTPVLTLARMFPSFRSYR